MFPLPFGGLKLFAAGVVLTAFTLLGLWGLHLSSELESSQKQVNELKVSLAQEQGANVVLRKSVDDQNSSMEKYLSLAQIASDNAQKAIDQTEKRAKAWEGKYNKVLYAPAPTSDTCKSLQGMLRDYIALRKQEAAQ